MEQQQAQVGPVDFERSRRKADAAHRHIPVRGFGPEGDYTLYLPSPNVERRIVYVAGRPKALAAESILNEPAIASLRDRVVRSFSSAGGVLSADLAFLEYCAAVLLINYDLSDEDLAFLLSGNQWHQPMVRHVCGGDDYLEAVARLAPLLIPILPPPAIEDEPEPHVMSAAPAARPGPEGSFPKPGRVAGLVRRFLKVFRR